MKRKAGAHTDESTPSKKAKVSLHHAESQDRQGNGGQNHTAKLPYVARNLTRWLKLGKEAVDYATAAGRGQCG